MRGLITAFRTLTLLPVPGRDAEDFSRSLPFFPVVGAVVGLIVAGVVWVFLDRLGLPLAAGAVGCALTALLTRGLHLDGLADTADALGGGRTRERRLEIMKDPHVGAFGVIAVSTCLLLKAAALSEIASFGHGQFLWIAVPFVISRTVMVEIAVLLPYARAEGGTASPFVRNSRPVHLIGALVVAAGVCFALSGYAGLLALLAGLVASGLLILWMRDVFGGVTGDLLGMANEVIETSLLLAVAAANPLLADIVPF